MINYEILSKSVKFYEHHNFIPIEVPWLVSEAISDITKPDFAAQYYVTKNVKTKTFVASGEQGFLYLMSKGHLPNGLYQTITPCIRNDAFDETHAKYFMKNELIAVGSQNKEKMLLNMVSLAETFFEGFLDKSKLVRVQTMDGFDIEFDGIEIGSYGIRECLLGSWVYGTGVAEPRFSRLVNSYKNKIYTEFEAQHE